MTTKQVLQAYRRRTKHQINFVRSRMCEMCESGVLEGSYMNYQDFLNDLESELDFLNLQINRE